MQHQGINLVEISSGAISIITLTVEPRALTKILTMMRVAHSFEDREH